MLKKLLLASAIVLALFLMPKAQAASANNFHFKNFTADYYLSRDENQVSHMKVVEQLTAVFPNQPQNHGITRIIPFTNNDGQNLTMKSDKHLKISVERNGSPEKISNITTNDGYFLVYIGDSEKYVTGEQTYTITYEFENLILDFADWQELYWDANGNDWTQRFQQVTARVHLDQDIAQSFTGKTSCYVGKYGEKSAKSCQISRSDDIITFKAENLYAHEGLTLDLAFAPGTFAMAPERQDFRLIIATAIAGLTSLVAIGLIVYVLRRSAEKRHYFQSLFVKPEYTPPRELTVAEAAKNYVGSHLRGDLRVATLLELAVQHKIELIKSEQKNFFGKMIPSWKIRIKSADLNQQQEIVLQILAGSRSPLEVGQEIAIKTRSASQELVRLARNFETNVDTELTEKGFLEARARFGQKGFNWGGFLQLCAVLWLIVWSLITAFLLMDSSPYIKMIGVQYLGYVLGVMCVGIFVALLSVGLVTSKFFSRTRKGLASSRYLEGLREYMQLAEAERLKMLQSVQGTDTSHQGIVKLYEKLLPYATLFGLEKSWLSELGKYYEFDDVAKPNWYLGVGLFSAHEFSAALTAANATVANSISHSTISSSSSSSSGIGGGGFSGGGGGGGGGGGW